MQRTKQVSANGFEPKICQRGDEYLHLHEADRRLVAVPIRQAGVLPLTPWEQDWAHVVGAGSAYLH